MLKNVNRNGHIRNRTGDLFLAREARYQLRHVPEDRIVVK